MKEHHRNYDYMVITKWPTKVDRAHSQYFMMEEIKSVKGTRLTVMEEEPFMEYFEEVLAEISDEQGTMTVFCTKALTIAICDNESGVVTESQKTFTPEQWYYWVRSEQAWGRLSVKDQEDGTIPTDTPLIKVHSAKFWLGGQMYALALELEYEFTGQFTEEPSITSGMTPEEEEVEFHRIQKQVWQVLADKVKLYGKLLEMDDDQVVPDTITGDAEYFPYW